MEGRPTWVPLVNYSVFKHYMTCCHFFVVFFYIQQTNITNIPRPIKNWTVHQKPPELSIFQKIGRFSRFKATYISDKIIKIYRYEVRFPIELVQLGGSVRFGFYNYGHVIILSWVNCTLFPQSIK